MSVEVAPLAKGAGSTVSSSSSLAAVLSAYFTPDLVFVVLLPIVATWFGLVGLGVIDEKPIRSIFRQLIGAMLLGGVVGCAAIFTINLLGVTGETAAFVTLSIAMVPVAVSKAIGKIGPRFIDKALDVMGLERKNDDDNDDALTGA